MPLRHKDTKISQRFKYQYHKLSEAFEPLCLCGRRRLFGVDSILIDRIGTFEFLFELQTATLWMVKENRFYNCLNICVLYLDIQYVEPNSCFRVWPEQ